LGVKVTFSPEFAQNGQVVVNSWIPQASVCLYLPSTEGWATRVSDEPCEEVVARDGPEAVPPDAFIPFEIYELVEKPTPLKALALVLNIAIVIYLVNKGRLFGVRGGHEAFQVEVRDSTLPADLLRSLGRSPEELTGTRIV
jgi:hypothetical protein